MRGIRDILVLEYHVLTLLRLDPLIRLNLVNQGLALDPRRRHLSHPPLARSHTLRVNRGRERIAEVVEERERRREGEEEFSRWREEATLEVELEGVGGGGAQR